ncbi:hypothetical protein HanRHA438_Chr08g0353641 [Helianthus annuus]|nr:hypothetical protein HanRHA438_Chr08g0353641 [Helianthus annuus]
MNENADTFPTKFRRTRKGLSFVTKKTTKKPQIVMRRKSVRNFLRISDGIRFHFNY